MSYVRDALKLLKIPKKYGPHAKRSYYSLAGCVIGGTIIGQQALYHADHYKGKYKGKSQLYRERMKKLPSNIDPWTEKPYRNS